jgi:hypothetical protein
VVPPSLKNPTVKAAIDAFQRGDRTAWSALFENDAGARIHRLDVGQVE